jgi:hypothetical protein
MKLVKKVFAIGIIDSGGVTASGVSGLELYGTRMEGRNADFFFLLK